MKKFILLLLLLPFLGFAQTDLVKWNGNPQTQGGPYVPTTIANNVSAEQITFKNLSPNPGIWNFFEATGWDTNNTDNMNKYIQFVIGGNLNNSVTINQINFQYNGGQNSYRVRVSKDPAFASYTTIASIDNATSNNQNTSGSISGLNISVNAAANEKLYVRFYAFNGNGQWNNGVWRLVNDVTFRGTATVPSALSGTMTIGSGSANTFTTITQAVNALNQLGVSGPVTFLLKDALYSTAETFPITINQVTGSSATNTITFKPAPTVNARIEAFRNPNSGHYTPVYAVFKLFSTDNIVFDGSNSVNGTTRNLTMVNSSYLGNGGYATNNDEGNRTVLWITSNETNGANNVTVKNTNIRQTYKNSQSSYCLGIFAGGNNMITDSFSLSLPTSAGNNANLTVINNDFENVKQAIFVNGSNNYTTDVTIRQNDLGSENNLETIILPAYLNNVNRFDYSENLVYNLRRETTSGALMSAGIYVTGLSQNGTITKNNMKNLIKTTTESTPFGGIVLESLINPSNITVANNFILNVAGNNNGGSLLNGHGIVLKSGGGYKIYHNTVSLNTNQSGTGNGYSSALYVNEGVNGLDVRNNIFANNQTNGVKRSAIMVRNHVSNINGVFTHLDYNSLFSTDKIGFIATGSGQAGNIEDFNSPYYITTFSVWKATTGKDTHSIEVNPAFASATDLHLAQNDSSLNNKGTFIAAVTKDIDGQLRNTTTPDMGADEFGDITMPAAGSNTGIYCTSSTTWNGTQWSNGTPTAEKDVIFTGNYTHAGTSGIFNACSVFVQGTAQVNFLSNANAVVVHNVNVAPTAALTFESSSNLIQVTNTINIGNVTVKRNSSKLKRLDYTIWSSPVSGTQTMKQFSPATAANRFYTYSTPNSYYLDIADITTATFNKAQGYLIRMPNSINSLPGYDAGQTATVYQGEFTGTPNNGNVTIPLEYYSDSKAYNAVGNPYPSPISVTNFIDANIDNIEGTLWIWRKTNDPTKSSYSTCTRLAYAVNAAPGGSNDLVADPFQLIDGITTPILNTAQGFIVKAKSGNKDLVFRNNMRKPVNYANFFRDGETTENPQQNFVQASRIWLNVVNNSGTFSQTVVGYLQEGTTGYDNGIDGKSFVDADVNIYSVIDTLTLAIQGRPDFTAADEVKLGFKTATAGTFDFTIDHVDGLFIQGQDIYIKDNVTRAIHNLNNGNYTFQTEAGTFNNRFVIVYANEPAMGTNDNIAADKDVVIYRSGKEIGIKSSLAVKSVTVYDTAGRLVYNNNNINTTEFTTSGLNTAQQVLIVKTELDNHQVISKKIMID